MDTKAVLSQPSALPCPFCGGESVTVFEGSSFRWRYAGCNDCGAQASEVRCQTTGEGTKEQWEAAANAEALEAWNRRASLRAAQPEKEEG